MLIDLTLPLDGDLLKKAFNEEKITFNGHLGTHFDVMNKEFPLEYSERKGIVFDVRKIRDRDIAISDVSIELVEKGMFVAFASGVEHPYGTPEYFHSHPQLTYELIDCLLARGVAVIGLDFAGIRRGREHTPTDQYCADRGCFIIENLVNLDELLKQGQCFRAHIYPLNFRGISGLPCRVVAEYEN